jgi:WD40 repeat protein
MQGDIQIWDTRSGRELFSVTLPGDGLGEGNVSPSGRFWVGIDKQGEFFLLDVQAGSTRKLRLKGLEPPADRSWAARFLFSKNEELLALYLDLGFSPTYLEVPCVEAFEALFARPLGMAPWLNGYFAPRAGRETFICHVLETRTGQVIATTEGDPNRAHFVRFTPDGHFLLLGMSEPGHEPNVGVWDAALRKLVRVHKDFNALEFSPDGRKIVGIAGRDYAILDLQTGERKAVMQVADWHAPYPTMLDFSPDNQILMVRTSLEASKYDFTTHWHKARLDVFDVGTGRTLASQAVISCFWPPPLFSPDSAYLLIDTGKNSINVLETRTLRPVWEKEFGRYNGWWPSLDPRFVIVERERYQFEVWHMSTGELRSALPEPRYQFSGPADYSRNSPNPRHLSREILPVPSPSPLAKLLGKWWPFPEKAREVIKVIELLEGRESARLGIPKVSAAWLSGDGRTLITRRESPGRSSFECWSLPASGPFQRPLWQIIGIPFSLAAVALLIVWARHRRRMRKAA